MLNVAAHLTQFAKSDPDRAAVIVARNGATKTFRELNEESNALANGLLQTLGRGARVAVMAPPSLEFFTLTFALFKAAAVPVMIDPGMGMKNLGTCLAEAEVAAFIGIPKAHIARRLYGWAKSAITINVGRSRFFCDHSTTSISKPGALESPVVSADETAAILFTSGSTGLAKGAVYTHGIFAAQVELLKTLYGLGPRDVDLCTFPLFALFGPALGMTCVVPTMNFSKPATIHARKTVAAMESYKVTNLFGSPAVIRKLALFDRPMPTLKRAISAGAPATLNVIENFSTLMNGQVFTPYGATEALPVANIGSDELLKTRSLTESGHGICIGRPVPGVRVHIIPIDDGPVPIFDSATCLPQGAIGEFVVRGPIVTKSYWKREESTKLAKMHDPATGETLHRMGDVGYFDELGRLWFCGRKSQRVVTTHGTLFTDQVEPIFNAMDGVRRTALVRAGDEPVLLVERASSYDESWHLLLPRLLQRAMEFELTKSLRQFLEFRNTFPVDVRHNSKINREKLAVWAAKRLKS